MTDSREVQIERMKDSAILSRGTLPIAIAARVEDVRSFKYAPWELLQDHAGIRWRKHAYGGTAKWIVRLIRIDEPMSMVEGSTVPLDQRVEDEWDVQRRERKKVVGQVADRIINEGMDGVRLDIDFDLERDVLHELWSRWREVTADGFLLRSLREQR